MWVRMLRARSLQHAGVETPLSVGQAYDLPADIGASLVATGAAEAVQTSALDDNDETAARRPPEGRPLMAPETKEGQGRRTRV
jgi:hypothetical protein